MDRDLTQTVESLLSMQTDLGLIPSLLLTRNGGAHLYLRTQEVEAEESR